MADDLEEDLDVEGVDDEGLPSLSLGIDPNELPSSSTHLSPELSQHPWLTFDDQFNPHIPDVVLHDDIDESSRITINQMIQEEHTYLQKNKFVRYQNKGYKTAVSIKKEDRPTSHNTRWTEREKEIFQKGIEQLGHRWKEIADLIGTRTHTQVKSYARTYLLSKDASDKGPCKDGNIHQSPKQEKDAAVCLKNEEDLDGDVGRVDDGDEMKKIRQEEEEEEEEDDIEIDVEDDSEDDCKESGFLQSALLFGDILRNNDNEEPIDSSACAEKRLSSGDTTNASDDDDNDDDVLSSQQTINSSSMHVAVKGSSILNTVNTLNTGDDTVSSQAISDSGSEGLSLPSQASPGEENLQVNNKPEDKRGQTDCETTATLVYNEPSDPAHTCTMLAKTEPLDSTTPDNNKPVERSNSRKEGGRQQLKNASSLGEKKPHVDRASLLANSEDVESIQGESNHRGMMGDTSRQQLAEGIEDESDSSMGVGISTICLPSQEKEASNRGSGWTRMARGRRRQNNTEGIVPVLEENVSHRTDGPVDDIVSTETTLASELPGHYARDYTAASMASSRSHDCMDTEKSGDPCCNDLSHDQIAASRIGSTTENSETKMLADVQNNDEKIRIGTANNSLLRNISHQQEISLPTVPKFRTGIGDEKEIKIESDVYDVYEVKQEEEEGEEEDGTRQEEEKVESRDREEMERGQVTKMGKKTEEKEKEESQEEKEESQEEKKVKDEDSDMTSKAKKPEEEEKGEEDADADEAFGSNDDEADDAPDNMEESTQQELPKEEVFLDPGVVTEEEKEAHSDFFDYKSATKTPQRYLVIRNHILKCWQKIKPGYLNKTTVRSGLSNAGNVNCIGDIHTYLESIGAINFGAFNPFSKRMKRRRKTEEKLAQQHIPDPERKRPKRQIKAPRADLESEPALGKSADDKPRKPKPRQPKSHVYDPFKLVECSSFSAETPGPFNVKVKGDAMVTMDLHAHLSTTEVIGLLGGHFDSENCVLDVRLARPCRSLSTGMQCEMDPVSQTEACEEIMLAGCCVVGWYHSHPTFSPNPSIRDIETQQNFQEWFSQDARSPFIGVIVSPYHNRQSVVSKVNYLTISKEWSQENHTWRPYKFDVSIYHERTVKQSHHQITDLATKLIAEFAKYKYRVEMLWVCPGQSGITYLEKMMQSVGSNLCGSEEEKNEIISRLRQMIFDQFSAKCSNVIKDSTLDVPLSFDSSP